MYDLIIKIRYFEIKIVWFIRADSIDVYSDLCISLHEQIVVIGVNLYTYDVFNSLQCQTYVESVYL
jgi:hypothetical protein